MDKIYLCCYFKLIAVWEQSPEIQTHHSMGIWVTLIESYVINQQLQIFCSSQMLHNS
jgi:hypothetical protein